MAGWNHRLVANFSQIADSLDALRRKGSKHILTSACQVAFERLKQHLACPPILGQPDYTLPFIVYTDASDFLLGAILAQQTRLGSERVIAFTSQTQWRGSTPEQECLSVVQELIMVLLLGDKDVHCCHNLETQKLIW